jgi:hypothetical protein
MTAPDISQFEPVDPAPAGQLIPSVRASDADRERTIGVLSEAFAEGRLTTEEHSARVEHVYGARTYAELDADGSGSAGRLGGVEQPPRRTTSGMALRTKYRPPYWAMAGAAISP